MESDAQAGAHEQPHPVAVVCSVRGNLFNAPSGRDLGPLCIKCGSADAPHSKVVKVTKTPLWLWFATVTCCGWVALYFILRRVSRHPIKLCSACRRRWRLSCLWQWTWTLVVVTASVLTAGLLDPPPAVGASIFFGGIVVGFAVPSAVFAGRRITAADIDDGYADLVGVSPAYITALGVPREPP